MSKHKIYIFMIKYFLDNFLETPTEFKSTTENESSVFDPANTKRRYNVAVTSRRCSDIVTTLLLRCVFAGESLRFYCILLCLTWENVPSVICE